METRSFFRILGALGALSLTLAACGSTDTNVGEQEFAVAGERCSPEGSTLPAEDGCNTCTCTASGTWACTLKGCGEPVCRVGEQKVAPDGCNTCTCTDGNGWACTEKACGPEPVCVPGTTRPDDCNSCFCSEDGQWQCTLIDCAPEPVCDLGAERASDDGCNTCTCTESGWACTDRACNPDPTTCTVGERRPADDGCNTCTCTEDGGWACTELACAPKCTPGEQQIGADGCNTCTCLESGDWACTKKACPTECTPGETKQVDCNTCGCTDDGLWACTLIGCNECPGPTTSNRPADLCAQVVTWAKDPNSGACCQYGTPCSAPAGWKQFGTEDACEKAATCPAPTTSFAPGGCSAVVIWAKDPASGSCCQYPDPCSAPEGWEQFYSSEECAGTK